MNNQAAQTMPELPEPEVHDAAGFRRAYTSAQMHQYARDYAAALSQTAGMAVDMAAAEQLCRIYFEIAAEAIGEDSVRAERDRRISALAAAPAASGVHTSTNEAWASRAQEKIAAMDATASVSERACTWPDCGHDTNQSGYSEGCTGAYCPPNTAEGSSPIHAAYLTWPEDIRRKLSIYDLRRMHGWAPRPNPGDWRIDTSAGGPILVYQDCSVIEGEQARYVLGLIAKDTALEQALTQQRGVREAAEAFLEAADARDNEETLTQYPEHERRLRQYKAAREELESLLGRGG